MQSSHILFHSKNTIELEQQFTHPLSNCLKLKYSSPSKSLGSCYQFLLQSYSFKLLCRMFILFIFLVPCHFDCSWIMLTSLKNMVGRKLALALIIIAQMASLQVTYSNNTEHICMFSLTWQAIGIPAIVKTQLRMLAKRLLILKCL